MSTSLALMELTEEITTALDDKKKGHCGCHYSPKKRHLIQLKEFFTEL